VELPAVAPRQQPALSVIKATSIRSAHAHQTKTEQDQIVLTNHVDDGNTCGSIRHCRNCILWFRLHGRLSPASLPKRLLELTMLAWLLDLITRSKKPKTRRSPQWSRIRAEHLKQEPSCQACGASTGLEVHHIYPVHLFPNQELLRENLITLCEGDVCNCHFLFGHLRFWRSYNPTVREDVTQWMQRIKNRP